MMVAALVEWYGLPSKAVTPVKWIHFSSCWLNDCQTCHLILILWIVQTRGIYKQDVELLQESCINWDQYHFQLWWNLAPIFRKFWCFPTVYTPQFVCILHPILCTLCSEASLVSHVKSHVLYGMNARIPLSSHTSRKVFRCFQCLKDVNVR